MNNSIFRTIKGLLPLALLALPLVVGAADQHRGMGDPDRHMQKMADKLELTADQRSEWQALHEAHHPRMQELREEMAAQRKALRQAAQDGFDEAAAEAAASRLGELVAESSLERARMHAHLQGMLTEEQREMMASHRDRMGKGKGSCEHKGKGMRSGKKDTDNH